MSSPELPAAASIVRPNRAARRNINRTHRTCALCRRPLSHTDLAAANNYAVHQHCAEQRNQQIVQARAEQLGLTVITNSQLLAR